VKVKEDWASFRMRPSCTIKGGMGAKSNVDHDGQHDFHTTELATMIGKERRKSRHPEGEGENESLGTRIPS